MQHRDRIALQKILKVIDETNEFLENVTEEEFLEKILLKSATAMSIIRIGELVKTLSAEFRQENSQVAWRDIAGFRDVTAHRYEILDFERVYVSIKNELPELKLQIEKILETK